MVVVHQFVPELGARDAVGSHMLCIQRTLTEAGIESHIWAGAVHEQVRGLAGHPDDAEIAPDDILIYQFAVGHQMAEDLVARSERLIINYHNVTPRHFFEAWDPGILHAVDWAREQLPMLASRCELSLAVSAFNAGELIELGFQNVAVMPILFDSAEFDRTPSRRLLDELRDGPGSRWLFVGRVVPNKAQHDIVKAFAVYRELYDPDAKLDIVGASSSENYFDAVSGLIDSLGLSECARMVGSVDDSELGAYYEAADVFVCMSEHEGFCVPLLEAMHHGVPIVAFAAGAVPETLAGAGVLLENKSPASVAAAVRLLLDDEDMADGLRSAGKSRLEAFALKRTQAKFLELIDPLVNTDG